jgi:hypothetical protein
MWKKPFELDAIGRDVIVSTLRATRCNVLRAAEKLNMPSHVLRHITSFDPEIMHLALEEREQLVIAHLPSPMLTAPGALRRG